MIDCQMEIKVEIDEKIGHVADIVKYKQPEISSFDRVMSQINIAGHSDFEKQLAQHWREVAGKDQLLSVLICEIDFYNEYVDNYGAQGASFMLLVVALALKNICEQQGFFLARYNQEGFAILIKGGDKQRLLEISDSLCKAVEESRTEHKYSKSSNIVTLRVAVSAVYPESIETLKSKADNALQNAKRLGRNQVSNNSQKMDRVVTDIEAQERALAAYMETEKQDKLATNINSGALNRDKLDSFGEPLKQTATNIEKKEAALRMYRGYAIDS